MTLAHPTGVYVLCVSIQNGCDFMGCGVCFVVVGMPARCILVCVGLWMGAAAGVFPVRLLWGRWGCGRIIIYFNWSLWGRGD